MDVIYTFGDRWLAYFVSFFVPLVVFFVVVLVVYSLFICIPHGLKRVVPQENKLLWAFLVTLNFAGIILALSTAFAAIGVEPALTGVVASAVVIVVGYSLQTVAARLWAGVINNSTGRVAHLEYLEIPSLGIRGAVTDAGIQDVQITGANGKVWTVDHVTMSGAVIERFMVHGEYLQGVPKGGKSGV
jgi:small-conductance mechanosensitive channel